MKMEVLDRQLSVSKSSLGTRKEVDPLTKIKLQLFPVDEVTRIGLEKDGLNPFLELTLKARNKISSVIKHIHKKWGMSHIATGDLMLLPCKAHLKHPSVTKRWTSKDTVISGGDVYEAVNSPAIFCLSYGWFSDHEPRRVTAETALDNLIESECIHKPIETTKERKCLVAVTQVAVTEVVDTEVKMGQHERSISSGGDDITNLTTWGILSEASGAGNISNELNSSQAVLFCTDTSTVGPLSEASLQGKLHNNELVLNEKNMVGHQQTPIPSDDNLTSSSIGGLQVSLQAKISNYSDPNSNETFISDPKWAGSDTTISNLMLLPYDVHVRHPPMSRWTLKDSVISARDVYTAVQSSAISRSSYHRFSHHGPQKVSAAALNNCIKYESIHKLSESTKERKCLEATAQVAVTAPVCAMRIEDQKNVLDDVIKPDVDIEKEKRKKYNSDYYARRKNKMSKVANCDVSHDVDIKKGMHNI